MRSPPPRSGPACGASSTPPPMTSSTPRPATASTRPWWPTTRRALRTSARSSTPSSWCSTQRDGMEIVILNPSGVYGPTPSPTPSFENEVFEPVVKKRLPAMPPGRHGIRLRRGGRRRATCWPPTRAGTASATSWPTGTRTSESWPKRPSESPAEGASRRGCPCPLRRRSRRSAPGSRGSPGGRRCSPRDSSPTSSGRRTRTPRRLSGSSGGRRPPSTRASARRSTRWACCDAA